MIVEIASSYAHDIPLGLSLVPDCSVAPLGDVAGGGRCVPPSIQSRLLSYEQLRDMGTTRLNL